MLYSHKRFYKKMHKLFKSPALYLGVKLTDMLKDNDNEYLKHLFVSKRRTWVEFSGDIYILKIQIPASAYILEFTDFIDFLGVYDSPFIGIYGRHDGIELGHIRVSKWVATYIKEAVDFYARISGKQVS